MLIFMYLTYVLLLSSSAHFHETGNASLEYSPDISKVCKRIHERLCSL